MKASLILAICAVFVISGCLVGNVEEQRDTDYGSVEGETSTASDTEDATTSMTSSGTTTSYPFGEGGSDSFVPLQVSIQQKHENRIVLGGDSEWKSFLVYYIENGNDVAVSVDHAVLQQQNANGDAADFVGVAVNSGPVILATGTLSLEDQTATLDFGETPLVVPPYSMEYFEVLGKMAPVQSSAACPSWHGCARSGHTPSLILTELSANKGQVSSEIETTSGWTRLLRKSKPIVTKQQLGSTTLLNADIDLIKWHIEADPAGPISWAQMRFTVQKSVGVAVSGFRLRRGTEDLDALAVKIVTSYPMMQATDDILPAEVPLSYVDVILANEDVIVGSGYVYTLHATVFGSKPGSELDIQLNTDDVITTGSLMNVTNGIWVVSDKTEVVGANALFSDLSEVPHTFAIAFQGGSSDWFTGILVNGLEGMHEHLTL